MKREFLGFEEEIRELARLLNDQSLLPMAWKDL